MKPRPGPVLEPAHACVHEASTCAGPGSVVNMVRPGVREANTDTVSERVPACASRAGGVTSMCVARCP